MPARRPAGLCALLLSTALAGGVAVAASEPRATLAVEADSVTVGDRVRATLTVDLPPASVFEPPDLGSRLGSFSVVSGAWAGPAEADGGLRWQWIGTLAAFETGELEIPAVTLRAALPAAALELHTAPLTVRVASVLDGAGAPAGEPELADIKPPASLAPDYGALTTGLAIFAALLGASLLLWWLHRRYASRLAAVPVPDDPFQRMPPHEWIYRELQQLLERRIAEQGQVDVFYSELSRILKRYLEGRYRVDLMEHTTQEVASRLLQAGAPDEAIEAASSALGRCDRVKFARERPGPEDWRAAVEAVYEIVDRTKPIEAKDVRAGRGAA